MRNICLCLQINHAVYLKWTSDFSINSKWSFYFGLKCVSFMNVLTVPEACLVQMQYSKNAAHMLHNLHIVGWPYETGTFCLM